MKQLLKRRKIVIASIILAVLIIGVAIVVVVTSIGNQGKETSSVDSHSVKQISNNNQATGTILAGKVIANNSNKIRIDSTKGKIKEVFVNEGEQVEKGQALFSYQTDQELKVKEAEVDKNVKANAVEVAKSNKNIKQEIYNEKNEQLKQAKNNSEVTQAELVTLLDGVKQAQLDLNTGDNEVKNAESELEKASLVYNNESEKLKDDTVLADNAGLVKTINSDLINQSAEKQKEENFMEIIDASKLFVSGMVNEFDKDKVSVDQPVEIVDREDGNKIWQGNVIQVSNLSSTDSNNSKDDENPNLSKFPYKVSVNENENMPVIESHVYIKLMVQGYDENKIILNKEYIVTKGRRKYVWLIRNNNIKLQEVTLSSFKKNLVEINEGLTVDDSIALPKNGMVEGMEVGENIKS